MEMIFVVEDDPRNLRLIRTILERAGYEVQTAPDAATALAALQDCLPALILTDLQLPGMNGLELTRRLKADPRTSHIPIVAVTANAMEGDEERSRAAGCDGYITKPFNTRTFPALVARHIEAATK